MNNPSSKIKISVIIPVYHVEGYIETCISSLKAQTLRELEYIFVDDCGTDASMSFVEAFAADDSRVRIIRNPHNMGSGLSRNIGIDKAHGEYLSFVDPDDWIPSNYYELLYQKSVATRADIIKGTRIKTEHVYDSHKNLKAKPYRKNSALNKRIYKTQQHKVPLFCVFTTEHTTAIYHRHLFDDAAVRYGTTCNAQDTTFLLRVCLKQPTITLENRAIYYYIHRKASATFSFSKKRAFEELYSFQEKADAVQALHKQLPKDEYAVLYLYQMLVGYFADACAARYQGEWDNNDIVRYRQSLIELMQRVEELFPHHSEPYLPAAELCAVREFGQWIPPTSREGTVSYENILQSWTVFLTEHPNGRQIYIRAYAKALIRTFLGIVVHDKDVGKECSLKFICKQLKQLDAKQRKNVIRALPYSILFLLKKRIRSSVYGFSI